MSWKRPAAPAVFRVSTRLTRILNRFGDRQSPEKRGAPGAKPRIGRAYFAPPTRRVISAAQASKGLAMPPSHSLSKVAEGPITSTPSTM